MSGASPGSGFFAVCALVSLLGAFATVLGRSPIRCAVGLLTTILGIAGLFLQLHAQFLATIQVIVYAGAVVVLFVFVIMLLGPDAGGQKRAPAKGTVFRALGGVLLGGVSLVTFGMVSSAELPPTRFGAARPEHGTVEDVGRYLFSRGIVPFELATALLLAAIVGAIAVARSKQVKRAEKIVADPTRRMFGGPVHPRDARPHVPTEGA